MSDIDDLVKSTLELKEKGFSETDIATELHVSVNTVTWLLTRDIGTGVVMPESDVKIGWRSIGVSGHRIRKIAEIYADIIIEEVEELETYDIRLHWISPDKLPGDWSFVNNTTVIGQADPPRAAPRRRTS